jgi:thiamine-monophosphate kinase
LSDIAAMGAKPEAAFLSIALPKELTGQWLERFLDGFLSLAEMYRVPLAGGDTADSRGLVSSDIVLLGSVPQGKALLRSGARAGDVIYVTGSLGGSAAELAALASKPAAFRKRGNAVHPHLYPEPRLKIGSALRQRGLATAAIDLSDGLSTDLRHLCAASRLNAVIEEESIPVAFGATLEQALHGGEDYELLFTIASGSTVPAKIAGVPLRAIGRMVQPRRRQEAGPWIEILSPEGKRMPIAPKGWEHFRG